MLLEDRNVQLFVTAAMTGVWQPLDVGVNRPLKIIYRDE